TGGPPDEPGRHVRQEVIEPVDDPDGLPKRVRQRTPEPDGAGADGATQPDDARSPEQIRAMMSSFPEGMERGRRDNDADQPEGDDAGPGEPALADGGQSGTGNDAATGGARRRGADGGVDDTTVEAT